MARHDAIRNYLKNIAVRRKTGLAREHAYRGDLQSLLGSLLPELLATNEPARIECGSPDFILTKSDVPVGFIEAKDLGKSLDGIAHTEQVSRYLEALPNLIVTNYTRFILFRNGAEAAEADIAKVGPKSVTLQQQSFDSLLLLLDEFASFSEPTITSSQQLAGLMAKKARLLAALLNASLESDSSGSRTTELMNQYTAFKSILIHDISLREFSDVYAQTIAYGMFAARLHDTTLETFSRQEAASLIPRSNPFLRKLFQYVAGYDLDSRFSWLVDSLADLFRAADVNALLLDFGPTAQQNDPMIHFYETFLAEYDPRLRKARGVWYTPQAAVSFIVDSLDHILTHSFGFENGLADTETTKISVSSTVPDKRTKSGFKQATVAVPRVQILDPATGTGTFLAQVVRKIYATFKGQEGIWPDYVRTNLLRRLYGFEFLMAPYAIAHLKLEMIFAETHADLPTDERIRIYLTNSLEEHHPDTGTLFATWLSDEAQEANRIKRDSPVLVVMGNPPYKGLSENMGEWISSLIEDYKYVDTKHFGEKKHWLHDDYVKFIRLAQHFVDRTGEGVVGFVNNNSFIDNPTFRGMRWQLLKSFDEIYILNLHGNANKRETAPDGSPDVNIFDIKQGVSINILVKHSKQAGKSRPEATVSYFDVWGSRSNKYDFLASQRLAQIDWKPVQPEPPHFFFAPRDHSLASEYASGFELSEMFPEFIAGIVTARDDVVIDFDRDSLLRRIERFADLSIADDVIRDEFFGSRRSSGKYPQGDTRGWKLPVARKELAGADHSSRLSSLDYRPFDTRSIYYHPSMVDWGRESFMRHMSVAENVGLCFSKRIEQKRPFADVFVFDKMIQHHSLSIKEVNYLAPLYLDDDGSLNADLFPVSESLRANVSSKLAQSLGERIGLTYSAEQNRKHGKLLTPTDVLDYVYAALHSPSYRAKFAEPLADSIPRVPFPRSLDEFIRLRDLGYELRNLHLLRDKRAHEPITAYPVSGTNEVSKRIGTKSLRDDRVWINETQYFSGISASVWTLPIGSYLPAQKWLKDRYGRVLSFTDVVHYQSIISVLSHTARIMEQVDLVRKF